MDKLNFVISQNNQWLVLASREIEQLQTNIQELEKGLNCPEATMQLRTEVTNLKNKVFSLTLYS